MTMCHCDLHNKSLIEFLLLFFRLSVYPLNKHCSNSRSWWNLNFTLAFYMDHFYSIFFGIIFNSRSCAWLFSDLGGVNMWMFGLLVTSSRIKSFIPSFIDILMTPHYSSRIGNQDSIPSEYWQYILQKWSYIHLMSLEYFHIFLSGQG